MWIPSVGYYSSKEKMAKKKGKKKTENGEVNEKSKRMIVISHVKGLSKRIARVMNKRRISTVK